MSLCSTILEIVFPIKCVSCGKRGADLCVKCLSDSPPVERENKKWIFSIFDYRHPPIKKAIKLMKYGGKKRIAYVLAEVMYGRILEELADLQIMENFRKPILIPIPLSWKRRRGRGYNQAELIAEKLIELDTKHENFTLEKGILIKIKNTENQAHIEDRRERLNNIIGSFSIKNNEGNMQKIKNRNIILIDDVVTTGATLEEAKKVLRQAGVKKIIAFTIAH